MTANATQVATYLACELVEGAATAPAGFRINVEEISFPMIAWLDGIAGFATITESTAIKNGRGLTLSVEMTIGFLNKEMQFESATLVCSPIDGFEYLGQTDTHQG